MNVVGKPGHFYVHDDAALEALQSFDGEEHLLGLLIKLLQPGDTFYDIGAEVGLYTVFLAQAVGEGGHVIAFEPQEHRFEQLQENMK